MSQIYVLNRQTGLIEEEKVYGEAFLKFLYNKPSRIKLFSLITKPFFSKFYGWVQKKHFTKRKIQPFIEKYEVDSSEFYDLIHSFHSFNEFFIRKLKKKARPLASSPLVMPADGRYLFYQKIESRDSIEVKGQKFSLAELLQDRKEAERYQGGSMIIARLCPTDYHRFHFPCSGFVGKPRLINGPLFSVNPLALNQKISYLSENKRYITPIQNSEIGRVLYVEVGATFVGSVHQTYPFETEQKKGAEKGYFEFGGSCLILLFEPDRIIMDEDLRSASAKGLEVKAQMGESLARCKLDNS
ncbi:MAG: archaetidylserine decarboxylase [Simkaniaceae bacterium]